MNVPSIPYNKCLEIRKGGKRWQAFSPDPSSNLLTPVCVRHFILLLWKESGFHDDWHLTILGIHVEDTFKDTRSWFRWSVERIPWSVESRQTLHSHLLLYLCMREGSWQTQAWEWREGSVSTEILVHERKFILLLISFSRQEKGIHVLCHSRGICLDIPWGENREHVVVDDEGLVQMSFLILFV